MCEPTTAMLALSIGSSVATLYQQQQAADAQERYNKQVYDNQMQTYRFNQAQSQFTRQQESQNLTETKIANNNAERRARSTATVASGEGGVSGLSVDALLADLSGRAGRDNVSAEVNYLRRDNAIQADAMNNWSSTASAINKLETPKAPDYLGAALKIGTAYGNYTTATSAAAKPWGGTAADPWYG